MLSWVWTIQDDITRPRLHVRKWKHGLFKVDVKRAELKLGVDIVGL